MAFKTSNSFIRDPKIQHNHAKIQEKRERHLEKRESILTFIPEKALDNKFSKEAERLLNEIKCLNQEELTIKFNINDLGIELNNLSHQS